MTTIVIDNLRGSQTGTSPVRLRDSAGRRLQACAARAHRIEIAGQPNPLNGGGRVSARCAGWTSPQQSSSFSRACGHQKTIQGVDSCCRSTLRTRCCQGRSPQRLHCCRRWSALLSFTSDLWHRYGHPCGDRSTVRIGHQGPVIRFGAKRSSAPRQRFRWTAKRRCRQLCG